MEDFDDYFNDDLVLDEAALAILDQEEQKFLSSVRQQPTVTKKLKTPRGWSPGIGGRAREDEFDDLPEISVTLDGKYGFTDVGSAPGPSEPSQKRRPNLPQPNLNRRVDAALSRPKSTSSTNVYPVQRQLPSNSNPPPLQRCSIERNSFIQNRPTGYPNQPGPEKQLLELQAQLQELKNENAKFQDALKEATEVRYTKEGEVAIMRKSIEKTAELHTAEIAKLKAAREEADARQKRIERQMKEETERLKTQFIFKQQELEASLRKPPMSARAVRVTKNIPETPRRVPSQITAWATSQGGENTPSKISLLERSPRKMRETHRSPDTKRTAALPGFQNAFMTTPLKTGPIVAAKWKGKGVEREDPFDVHTQVASQRAASFTASSLFHQSVDSPGSTANSNDVPNDINQVDEDGDVVMLEDVSEGLATEVEAIEPLNHKVELSRVILMHAHINANEGTFQLLTSLSFSQKLSDTQVRECTQACQAILVALSNPMDGSDYPVCALRVTKYLILILQCLVTAEPCFPLIALLNLISFLASSLPNLASFLLSHDKEGKGSLLLTTICDLAERLAINSSTVARDSTREMLSLLESLLCSMPDEAVSRFPFTPKEIHTLMAFLSASRPQKLVEALSRVLMVLATHTSAYPQLSVLVENNNGEYPKDSPLIHGLCIYLLENLDGDLIRINTIHSNLIGCLTQVSLTQIEHLVESALVIPTLVYFVCYLATKLWNADEGSLSATQARTAIRSMNQGLFLLHNLVHASEPSIRLHDKLQHSSHRNLNNLVHMFTVSFGQMSYSDPPDWIDGESKAELEGLVEPARELLDLVMDGPESDSVWIAYQMEPENDSDEDEEEIEARLMEAEI
ncbi:hypothetical protein AGABI1DRAFT_127085 [Agaricus bisporus var. burnettii JB137-S8]|uniref:Uncharacterized protein n=1 Tax=Agaricus bisporus var. burnettii (strain JB137-S8 / ATCC MYA-4627 / FGSC 10392) TaxID=597362 RepID=K5XCK8_AGABU|nr:uncharacterized protein AGABI1DRAFT_127085 [Agaricus bisporus var. burnettii JB137-S8]EKM81043.1 hypothetical protein AGABI1DRAFT_127085 [Agaricus bisporus var. burnettii JB137-S8]